MDRAPSGAQELSVIIEKMTRRAKRKTRPAGGGTGECLETPL
jgi:hypothetical protein